jgi:acetylglutamate kinase
VRRRSQCKSLVCRLAAILIRSKVSSNPISPSQKAQILAEALPYIRGFHGKTFVIKYGGKAVGLSGQDGHFIRARKLKLPPLEGEKEETDLGLVGDIERIDTELINLLHTKGFIPVVMPIGVGSGGEAYNINADVVAGKLAEALKAEKLILMTNTPGVLDKHGTLVTGLTSAEIATLFADGTIHGGMLPKLESALQAVKHGVKSAHVIDGRVPNALLLEVLTSEGVGTMICSDDGPHFLADTRRYLVASVTA